MRVEDGQRDKARMHSFYQPFRLGYGKQCDLYLDGAKGPDVLIELNRVRGPLRLSTPLARDELRTHVDISVNGRPLEEPIQELEAGTRLEVIDKATKNRYRLVVDPPRFWLFRPRVLAGIMLVLAVVGAAYGGFVYHQLRAAQERLAEAESDLQRTDLELDQAVRRIESAELQFVDAIEDYKAIQQASEREIREAFNRRLDDINQQAHQNLQRLSEQDVRARADLRTDVRANIDSVRKEFADKMVQTYDRFKTLKSELLRSLAAQAESIQLEGTQLKRILDEVQNALLFIRISYAVESTLTGKVLRHTNYGSGFILGPDGLSMTTQHVLYPWRYERQFLVLEQLDLVRLQPDSVRWEVWTTGERVLSTDTPEPEFRTEVAYRNDWGERAMHLIHAPDIDTTNELAESPMGLVSIQFPRIGRTDVAVFQLIDASRRFAGLEITKAPDAIEPLDDVLVVGYPLARLEDNIAKPQGTRGFVRRTGRDLIELDSAFHPGVSGAPVLNLDAEVIGMASAFLESNVYGVAVRSQDLLNTVEQASRVIERDQQRLTELECYAGPVHGLIDKKTWDAYRCEHQLESQQQ